MRAIAVALAAIGWLTTAMSAVDGLDVRGSVRASGRPQPNTVIWLEAPHATPSPSAEKIVLDQRNLNFYPHVLAVRVDTTVDFPNSDRVFHNVFSFRDGKRFDLGMYPIGAHRRVTFDRAGLSRLFCNIHPNMAAYVMAVDTPYFSVADGQGARSSFGGPAGNLHVPHLAPRGGDPGRAPSTSIATAVRDRGAMRTAAGAGRRPHGVRFPGACPADRC